MGALVVNVAVNTLAFYLVSTFLPGFEVKNRKKLVIAAVVFSLLTYLALFLLVPLISATRVVIWLVSLLPFVGGVLAGASRLVATFLITITTSAILLMATGELVDDFRIRSR